MKVRKYMLAALVAGGVGGGFLVGRLLAAGIPATSAMTYSGTLVDASGAPLTANQNITINLWSTATPAAGATPLCTVTSSGVKLTAGRFSIPLPDTCTAAVHTNPDVWVDVVVGGMSLGLSKMGAVPYAAEAAHATSADSATSAGAATAAAGALATQLASLEIKSGFHAVISSASSSKAITSASATTVVFDSVDFDSAGEYNAATGVFTATAAGTYVVQCAVTYAVTLGFGGSAIWQVAIVYNGNHILGETNISAQGNYATPATTLITTLAAHDTLSCTTFQNTQMTQSIYTALPGSSGFGAVRIY